MTCLFITILCNGQLTSEEVGSRQAKWLAGSDTEYQWHHWTWGPPTWIWILAEFGFYTSWWWSGHLISKTVKGKINIHLMWVKYNWLRVWLRCIWLGGQNVCVCMLVSEYIYLYPYLYLSIYLYISPDAFKIISLIFGFQQLFMVCFP